MPSISRLPIHEEIAALWHEIVTDTGMDVDAALAEAHRTIADRIAEAEMWDALVAAMRDGTAAAPIGPHAPAQTA